MGMDELPPPPPFRPLQRRRAGAILYSLTLLAGIIWFAALPVPVTEGAPRSRLEEAVAGADRLVFQAGDTTLLELNKPDEIAEFLALVEWRLTRPEEYKEQEGPITHQVLFFRGDKEVARLDSVAKYALRWVNGSWPGDVVLTPGSRYKLNRWYLEHNAMQLRPHTSDTAPK